MTTPATPGAPRAAELATQVETANRQLIDVVGGCSNEDWRQRERGLAGRRAGPPRRGVLRAARRDGAGRDERPGSGGALAGGQAAINARHAEEYARVGKQETLDALRRNGTAATGVVRGLSDAQLARTTTAFGGRGLSVAQLVEGVLIGHPRQHLASIRTALAS